MAFQYNLVFNNSIPSSSHEDPSQHPTQDSNPGEQENTNPFFMLDTSPFDTSADFIPLPQSDPEIEEPRFGSRFLRKKVSKTKDAVTRLEKRYQQQVKHVVKLESENRKLLAKSTDAERQLGELKTMLGRATLPDHAGEDVMLAMTVKDASALFKMLAGIEDEDSVDGEDGTPLRAQELVLPVTTQTVGKQEPRSAGEQFKLGKRKRRRAERAARRIARFKPKDEANTSKDPRELMEAGRETAGVARQADASHSGVIEEPTNGMFFEASLPIRQRLY